MIDNRLFPIVEDRMDWIVKRQQVLNDNISNQDTPGYRARDVKFSDQLQMVQLNTRNKAHIPGALSDPRMEEYEVNSTVQTNGNSVDLDREMTEMTKNGLQYIAMVQFVSQKLKTLRSAINEGGKG